MAERTATYRRETRETRIEATVNLDGDGTASLNSGNGMLDHLLNQLARHGQFDITLEAKGDWLQTGWHHTVEDTAIALGRAFAQALGDGAGIRRMGHALVPMDETLARVAVDLSGRGYAALDLGLSGQSVGDLPGDLVRHFLHSFATEARLNLHATILAGLNPHHMAESTFKGLARALRDAVEPDPRAAAQPPSTKGTISG